MPQLSFKIQADYDKVQRLREEIAKLKQEIKGVDVTQTPQAFNVLNAKLVQTSQELGKVEGKIIAASATMETDFKQKIFAASQSVNGFTEKIIAQKAVVKDVAADVKRLAEEYQNAAKHSPMMASDKLAEWKAAKRALDEEKAALFGLTQEQATARLSVKKFRDEYALFKQEGGGTAQTMDLLTSKMKGIAATIMGGMGLKELAGHIISVRAEFESMETSLKVLLGGNQERLNSIVEQIKDYALASPLNTKDMVGAVQMMTSFGIEAEKSIDYLKAIGDISMGDTGKFNSLALAFSQMSSAGKLMGQDLLQMVNAGFNPLEEISRKTGKSIGQLKEEMSKGAISSKMVQDAFISATSAGGKFFGMADEGSKTLNGQISMLQESFDNMFNEIGQKGEGVVMTAVQTATKLVENYEQVGRVLLGLVETYGAYRVGLAVATVAQNGHTLAMTLARTRILLTQKAQALLNATMLANPYVLAATALGAVIAGLISMKTQTERVEDATRRYNEEKQRIIEQEQRHNEEIQKLCDIAGDESLSTENRRLALVKLEQKYPSVFKKYDTEAEKLAHILEIKQQIAVLDGKTSITNAKVESENINKRITSINESLRARQTGSRGHKDNNIGVATQTLMDEQKALMKRQGELSKQINKDNSDNYLKNLTGVSNSELAKQINVRKNLLANMNLTGKRYGKITSRGAKGTFSKTELEGQIGILESEQNKRNKPRFTTKKDLQDQKKSLQAQLDGLSEIEAKGKKGAELRKKINAISEREKVYSATSDTKAATKAEKERKQRIKDAKAQQKANEDLAKQKIVQSEAELELDNQVEQSRIDSLMDGSEKTIAAMKLAHKREMEQIEKQKQDYLKKKQEEAKAKFEADPKNKDKVFKTSSVTLSKDEQSKFNTLRENTEKKHVNEDKEAEQARINAFNDYLKEYGSMQEKRLAIAKEYDEKIAKAQSDGERLKFGADKVRVLSDFDIKVQKDAINWEDIFSNLDSFTKTQLESIKSKLRDMLSSKDLDLEGYKTAVEQIDRVNDAILSAEDKQRSFLGVAVTYNETRRKLEMDIADALQRQADATNQMSEAQVNMGMKQYALGDALSNAGIGYEQKDLKSSNADAILKKVGDKNGVGSEKYKAVQIALDALAKSEREYNSIVQKKNKADRDAESKQSKLNKYLEDFAARLQDLMPLFSQINDNLQDLPGLLGELGISSESSVGKTAANLANAGNAAMGAAADYMSGNYVGAAMKGISAIKSFGSALGIGSGNEKEVAKTTERLTKSNEHLAERIDDLSDIIGNSAGARAVNAYDTALKAQKEINKNSMEILKAQMGYHSAHHSNASYADDRKIASYNKDAQLAFKAAGVNASTINGLSSIYNLTPEQLKAIKDFAPDLWRYLTEVGKYDKSKYWDDVVEQAGKTEKLTEQIQDNITQTSFDSLRSGFLDTLMDMNADAEDWSKNFEKMLFKSFVSTNILNDEFNDWLKAFQEKWANKIKSGNMSNGDWSDYRDEYSHKMAEKKREVDAFAASVGYSETDSQKATINEARNLSEDTGSQIVGRLTAAQIAVESGNVKRDTANVQLSLMNAKIDDFKMTQIQTRDIADETRTILADSYLELKEINTNTGNSAAHLKEIRSDLKDLKKIMDDKL